MSSQPSWRVLLGILGGGVSPVLYILVLFQTKKCHFSHPLNSDLATKKFMSLFILRLEQQQQQQQKNKQTKNKKNKNKKIYIYKIFVFLSYSFGIKTNNAFIPSHSSLENHSLFQTKVGKVHTSFQTRTAQKPSPLG